MINNALTSIKAQLYERVNSPLTGSFVISWCVWNYKFILVILTTMPIVDKFQLIDKVLFLTAQQRYFQGLLYPILTTLVYLYIYPYPAKYVLKFTKEREQEALEVKQEIEKKRLLTLEKSIAIQNKIDNLEEDFQKTIDRKNKEINDLKLMINQSQDKDKITKNNSSNLKITNHQLDILKTIGNSNEVPKYTFLNENTNKVQVEHDIGELLHQKLILTRYEESEDDEVFDITQAGRKILIANKST